MNGIPGDGGRPSGAGTVRDVLRACMNGSISLDDAEHMLKGQVLEEIENMASLDLFRELRSGIPEIIFAESKSIEQLERIVERFVEGKGIAIMSRLTDAQLAWLATAYPAARVNVAARMATVAPGPGLEGGPRGTVGVITAGTSDIPVAEEAAFVAAEMGCRVEKVHDIGIAGIHRVFKPLKRMLAAGVDAIVCCAGMEGALPSIIASLTDVIVIGVPVSTGYGLGGLGETAIRSMLQSCSPGLVVVNINNGTGAGAAAALVARRAARDRAPAPASPVDGGA